jgi:hypothetical protein
MEAQPRIDIRHACDALVQALTDFVQAALAALKPVLQRIYDACHATYLAAGAPYGDTPDGMVRWYREALAIAEGHTVSSTASPFSCTSDTTAISTPFSVQSDTRALEPPTPRPRWPDRKRPRRRRTPGRQGRPHAR